MKLQILIVPVVASIAALPMACGDSGGGGSARPESGQQMVSGTIRFSEIVESFENAVVVVRIEDVSRADAPAKTVAEYVISGVSMEAGGPRNLPYSLNHAELEPRRSYAMRIHVDVDRSGLQITVGDYINTSRYRVPPEGVSGALNIDVDHVPGSQQ